MQQDLKFRRKRRKGRKKKTKQMKSSKLKFGNQKRKLKFERKKGPGITKRGLIWMAEIFCACAVAALLVAFFGHRLSVAGDAMNPTLNNGEVVLVNRLIYDMKSPSRGDVVAFRPNGNKNVHKSVRRIVGLPGEIVQIKDGKVYINDTELKKHVYVSEIEDAGTASEPVKLGKNEYFVLGDNAAVNGDSRYEETGTVTLDDIYGKAWFAVNFGGHFGFIKN